MSEEVKQNPNSEKLFANYSEKERKTLFLYVTVAIVLLELAASVGAVVYSIVRSERSESGLMQFQFPWLGFSVAAFLIPVMVLLILHLTSMIMNRDDANNPDKDAVSGKAATFFTIVRGAPTIILLTGLIVLGAVIYYVDGVMSLVMKLADSFESVALWLIGALTAAFCVKGVAQAIYRYKMNRMEAEYAFRREVLEKTGMVVLDSRLTAHTELRRLESGQIDVQPSYRVVDALPGSTTKHVSALSELPEELQTPKGQTVSNVPDAAAEIQENIPKTAVSAPVVTPRSSHKSKKSKHHK